MLTIRLHRIGKTNQPQFKIVVVDKRFSASAGKFREEVGLINRVKKQVNLNKERINYWIGKGAQASPTVHNILVAQNVINAKKIVNHSQPKKAENAAAAAPVAAAK